MVTLFIIYLKRRFSELFGPSVSIDAAREDVDLYHMAEWVKSHLNLLIYMICAYPILKFMVYKWTTSEGSRDVTRRNNHG